MICPGCGNGIGLGFTAGFCSKACKTAHRKPGRLAWPIILSVSLALVLATAFAARAGEHYIIGQETLVAGEAFCVNKNDISKVAEAFSISNEEGLRSESETCVIPARVFMVMGHPVVQYVPVRVTFVRIVGTVKPPDDERRVTFIEVTASEGRSFFMTTYHHVEAADIPL